MEAVGGVTDHPEASVHDLDRPVDDAVGQRLERDAVRRVDLYLVGDASKADPFPLPQADGTIEGGIPQILKANRIARQGESDREEEGREDDHRFSKVNFHAK